MHKEKYEDLMLRFAKELHEVGVTENMKKIVADQLNRAPNVASAGTDETTDRFSYRHGGYLIEAKRSVEIIVKKVL